MRIILPILVILTVRSVHSWSGHDITTLKLLQVVHRHGDRAPHSFVPNDPYKNLSAYWPEGKAELTAEGRERMYRIGQFIRAEYQHFLGNNHSPREVYARSSLSYRVMESCALVLAGLYPPDNPNWQWNDRLGRIWQPIPIETFMPKKKDIVLTVHGKCPTAENAEQDFYKSEQVTKLIEANKEFLAKLSRIAGTDVTLKVAETLYTTLEIEHSRGHYWSATNVTTKEFEHLMFDKLKQLSQLWNNLWADEVIERFRGGPLVAELLDNMLSYTTGKPRVNSLGTPYKVMVYGTHDTKLAALMNALDIFNRQPIPFGATLLFELHQVPNVQDYFVRIHYHNETLNNQLGPYELTIEQCTLLNQCSIDVLANFAKKEIPDWDEECGSGTRTLLISKLVLLFVCIVNYLCLYSKKV